MRIGTDPEVFIRTKRGVPVPAHMLFPDKYHKKQVSANVLAFRDGYAVELNPPACNTPAELAREMQAGVKGIVKLLPAGHTLYTAPTIEINLARDLRDAPEDVKHFGCEPSYCGYTGRSKVPQINAWEHKYRYGGAHMHFSATPAEFKARFRWLRDPANHRLCARMWDFHVGIPLTCILHGPGQYLRRKYYGQAGEYRPQEYPDGSVGLEYRTPPPELWNNYDVANFAFTRGMDVFANFELYKRGWDASIEEEVKHAINTGEGRVKLLHAAYRRMVENLRALPATRSFALPFQVIV